MKYFLAIVVFLISFYANAQCAMCRAVLETEDGGIKGGAVNDGIVYLMIIPYLLVAGIGYVIYKMKNNNNLSSINNYKKKEIKKRYYCKFKV